MLLIQVSYLFYARRGDGIPKQPLKYEHQAHGLVRSLLFVVFNLLACIFFGLDILHLI